MIQSQRNFLRYSSFLFVSITASVSMRVVAPPVTTAPSKEGALPDPAPDKSESPSPWLREEDGGDEDEEEIAPVLAVAGAAARKRAGKRSSRNTAHITKANMTLPCSSTHSAQLISCSSTSSFSCFCPCCRTFFSLCCCSSILRCPTSSLGIAGDLCTFSSEEDMEDPDEGEG